MTDVEVITTLQDFFLEEVLVRAVADARDVLQGLPPGGVA